jgi:hypothetical protein
MTEELTIKRMVCGVGTYLRRVVCGWEGGAESKYLVGYLSRCRALLEWHIC